MTTDYRALCAELESHLSALSWSTLNIASDDEAEHDLAYAIAELCSRARAALAQPEPVGPTNKELLGCMLKAAASVPGGQCTGILDWDKEAIAAARAVLARWGRPAITPIPVSERLPGPDDCDAHGWCWVLYEGYQTWTLEPPLDGSGPRGWSRPCGWTHWLPATALPLPGQPAPTAPAP